MRNREEDGGLKDEVCVCVVGEKESDSTGNRGSGSKLELSLKMTRRDHNGFCKLLFKFVF